MEKLTSAQIKERLLRILVWFRDRCEEKGYRYYITGGTLLGAVRHGGFIPWDDDVDVLMPASDYEQFIHDDFTGAPYQLRSYDLDRQSTTAITKLYDPSTTLEAERHMKYPLGVHIDIFALYPLGETLKDAQALQKDARVPRKFLNWLIADKFYIPKKKLNLLPKWFGSRIAKLYGLKRVMRKTNAIKTRYTLEQSNYVGHINGAFRECAEKWQYDSPSEITFEGERFMCCADPHKFLTGFYGDYMTPPPENDRINHGFAAYIKNDGAL